MPRQRGIPDLRILPSMAGRFVTDTWRGQTRVRKWPKPAGKAKAPALIASQRAFKQASDLIKIIPASQYEMAIRMTKGSGLYPRDLLMATMRRGIMDILDHDGVVLHAAEKYLEEVMYQGARIEKNTIQAYTQPNAAVVTFQVPIIDSAFIWSASNPNRLTVPTNTEIVNVRGAIRSTTTATIWCQLSVRKNGTTIIASQNMSTTVGPAVQVATGPIDVNPGDYFELLIQSSGNQSLEVSPRCFLAMDLLQVVI